MDEENQELIYKRERLFMMIQACKMKIFPGQEAEYKRRHDEIWPEMIEMIHERGGRNYSIFFDKETNYLFSYIEVVDEEKWNQASTELNYRWWNYMADIMETNADNSPVSVDLPCVFHLD